MQNSREFYLADIDSTLFPLNTNLLLIDKFSKELAVFLQEEVLVSDGGFNLQHRAYASKKGWYLRPTLKLDPVAEYFLYDFVYRNRALFRKDSIPTRRSLGFRITHGQTESALLSYSTYKKALAQYRDEFQHRIYFDIASYFNHLYHHDLVRWIEAQGAASGDVQLFGRFLREIVGGRSIDCLPQGLYPAKMIGSSFLNFIEKSGRIHCSQTLRLMDDVWLFDNDDSILVSDFVSIQMLLANRGLSINAGKSDIEAVTEEEPIPGDIDEMKLRLLQKRRAEFGSDAGYGDESEGDDRDAEDLQDLTEDEQEYLVGLLNQPDIQEEDAELVLTLMRDHSADVIEYLPRLISDFPNLTKRMYYFCRDTVDRNGIAEILLSHLRSNAHIPEFQLFWLGKLTESSLLQAEEVSDLLFELYEHKDATAISKAKILEIPENRFGLPDLREEQLKTGHSDWLSWSAAVGSRLQSKAQRNQLLKYFRKSSSMNRLIGEFVETCF